MTSQAEKNRTLALADGVLHELEMRAELARTREHPDLALGEAIQQILAGRELCPDDEEAVRYHLNVILREDVAEDAGKLSLKFWNAATTPSPSTTGPSSPTPSSASNCTGG